MTHQRVAGPAGQKLRFEALCGGPHGGDLVRDVTLFPDPCPDCLTLLRLARGLAAGR